MKIPDTTNSSLHTKAGSPGLTLLAFQARDAALAAYDAAIDATNVGTTLSSYDCQVLDEVLELAIKRLTTARSYLRGHRASAIKRAKKGGRS